MSRQAGLVACTSGTACLTRRPSLAISPQLCSPKRRERPILWLFTAYKRAFAPVLHALSPTGGGCVYQPTCSEYAALALAQHGWLRGTALASWRLLRCNPLSRGGWDPVPAAAADRHAALPLIDVICTGNGADSIPATPAQPAAGTIETQGDRQRAHAHSTRTTKD
jgi:putative membrane protein insertion efficiency factor